LRTTGILKRNDEASPRHHHKRGKKDYPISSLKTGGVSRDLDLGGIALSVSHGAPSSSGKKQTNAKTWEGGGRTMRLEQGFKG